MTLPGLFFFYYSVANSGRKTTIFLQLGLPPHETSPSSVGKWILRDHNRLDSCKGATALLKSPLRRKSTQRTKFLSYHSSLAFIFHPALLCYFTPFLTEFVLCLPSPFLPAIVLHSLANTA